MPDLRLREVHLPELRLPEMSRDDIIRAIGDATRDVDLSRFDPRRSEPVKEPSPLERAKARIAKVDLSRIDLSKVDLSKVDLSRVDVPKAIATAGQAAGLVRRSRRPRLPLIIGGLVTIGLIGYALATSPVVRPRLDAVARKARARMDAMREAADADESIIEAPDVETLEAVEAPLESAEAAEAVAVPIEPTAFLEETLDVPAVASDVTAEPLTEASRN